MSFTEGVVMGGDGPVMDICEHCGVAVHCERPGPSGIWLFKDHPPRPGWQREMFTSCIGAGMPAIRPSC